MRDIQLSSFPEFSISMDGTPSFADSECIILRSVNRWTRSESSFVQEKPDSDELANHILKCFHVHLHVPLVDWVPVQLDRASTNKAAISKLKNAYPDANSKEVYCISHGLNNVGKKLFGHAKFVEELRKLYQAMIQYPE